MSVDLSFMDLLFDKEDPVIGFDKDIKHEELKQFHIDDKQLHNDDWVCNADSFLDSILQMGNDEQPFEIFQNCDLLNDTKEASDSFHLESSSCSDSGLSSDQQMSPPPSIHETEYDEDEDDDNDEDDDDDDIEIKEEIIEVDSSVYDEMPTLNGGELTRTECLNEISIDDTPEHQLMDINEKILERPILKNNQRFSKPVKPSQIQIISSDTVQQKEPPQQIKPSSLSSLKDHKTVIRTKPIGVTNPSRHVLRVTPITSSNPRSILIPVNMKNVGTSGVRTIKIINATNRTLPANTIKATRQIPRIITPSTSINEKKTQSALDGMADEDPSSMYPRLHLTGKLAHNKIPNLGRYLTTRHVSFSTKYLVSDARKKAVEELQKIQEISTEEKRLMEKEGVSLPSHYPLTKQEERDLKRIRRKIRNKISAQDSRKRKKEYLDGLEDRVKQCTEENLTLMKRLKVLQSQNQSLSTQLKKLQAVVARGTTQTAQPATCLMVLMLSLALVMAPNMRHTRSATERDLSLPERDSKNPLAGRSRTLLFSKQSDVKFKSSDMMAQESEESWESGLMSDLEELLMFNKPMVQPSVDTQCDHDYTENRANRKRTRSYIVPPLDDSWPPPKKLLKEKMYSTLEEKINKSRLGTEPLEERDKRFRINLSSSDKNNVNCNYGKSF